jgi:hypothetical protein
MVKARVTAIVAAATLGTVALTGATIALAADDTTPSSASDSPTGADPRGMRGGHHGDHGFGDRGLGGPREGFGGELLHGEGVAEDADGTIVTIRMQQGEVTTISATSMSVKSADGYTSTYAINDQTMLERDGEDTAPKVGDTVHVRATVDGTVATADHVHALSPERAQELEDHRAAMEDWLAERPEGPGRGAPGHGGPGFGGPGFGGPGN